MSDESPGDGLPPISVALCTHNGARFVQQQLESIAAQTVRPSEIVVSDDASADATREIVRAFFVSEAASGMRCVLLENPVPLGVVANFEQALVACRGELVVLSDQDDVWRADRIAHAARRFADEDDLLLLGSDARIVDDRGRPTGLSLLDTLEVSEADRGAIHDGRAFAPLLKRNLVTGATVMLRGTLLRLAVPFPPSWVHDEWLAAIAASTGRVDVDPQQLIDYRQHGANQIGVRRLGLLQKLGRLVDVDAGRNSRLLERAMALSERLDRLGDAVPVAFRDLAARKVAHHRLRAGLPAARLARVAPILRELRRGGYSLFGRGWADAARDLIQPAG
jgi:glycosyltransferase involved in cell wall biosynthesis